MLKRAIDSLLLVAETAVHQVLLLSYSNSSGAWATDRYRDLYWMIKHLSHDDLNQAKRSAEHFANNCK